jgi:hypothetical protein
MPLPLLVLITLGLVFCLLDLLERTFTNTIVLIAIIPNLRVPYIPIRTSSCQ